VYASQSYDPLGLDREEAGLRKILQGSAAADAENPRRAKIHRRFQVRGFRACELSEPPEDRSANRGLRSKQMQGQKQFTSRFALGDKVVADGEKDLVMRVTAMTFRSNVALVECSYFANSDSKVVWVEEWRLSAADHD
jgi:hypothetical protein